MVETSANPTSELSVTRQVGVFRYALAKVMVHAVAAVAVVIVPDWSSPTTVPVPVPQLEITGAGPDVKVCPSLSIPNTAAPVEVATAKASPVEAPDWTERVA